MNIKTLNVFYGGDFLPYKDKERQVHYPNVGSDFQGAENITDIRFYIDNIASNNTTFAVAIELPNGKIGSKVLDPAQYDSEVDEYYVTLAVDKFVTQKAGNVSISLRGYQGDIELEYDDESQLYVLVSGTPITAVTGSIKLRVNQEPQGLQGDLDEEVTLQEVLALISTKLNIVSGIVVLGNISTANLSGYEVGQLFYDEYSGTYYEKTETSQYYKKASDESGVLGSANILCKNGDSALTISKLHEIYGNRSYFVYRYLDKDILFNIVQVAQNDYKCVAFDIESQCFYEKVASGSALPSSVLIPANKIEIASKALLVSNYVPYNGANDDVDLGEHKISAKQLNLPQGKLRTDSVDDGATLLDGKFLYDNERTDQKEDERAISSVKYVLDNALNLDEVSEIGEGEYAYLLKTNSTILLSGDIYKHITDTQNDLVYAFFNGSVTTQTDGTSLYLGDIIKISKTEVGGVHQYNRESVDIDLYSKSQAKGKFVTNFTASLDTTTYVLTFTLKNANGDTLATQTIDLPLESIVTSMTYYDTYTYDGTTYHNVLVIVLATTSVPTIVPVGSLISGLEHEALVEVSDISTPLTASQLALLEYPNAMIKYGYNVYLKSEDNGTYITLSVPYISLATNSGHEEATRKFIVVTKSSGAMALTSDTTSFYNKSQTDSLLDEKADASSVVTDSDIETLGGAITRIRKGNTWNEVAQQVNMSTTPKVVQSVADLPADNDGYLYVVLDDGYLYSWDEENEEWAQQYQYTSDLLTITEVEVGGDDYSYIEDKTNNNRPIQVESAKKDANGEVIDETYAKISDLETIDERLDNHDTEIAKLKKDVDYAMKYPLLYGTPTTDTEEEVGLTTSQFPATTLPKGLINYVGGMSQKVNQLANWTNKWNTHYHTDTGNIVIEDYHSNFNADSFKITESKTNHKYFIDVRSDTNYIKLFNYYRNIDVATSNTPTIYTENNGYSISLGYTNEISAGTHSLSIIFADLTEIYGAGNEPTSTSDPRIQWLIHYLTDNPQYDEGSIVNAPVENIVSKGFNIWDEEWENGVYSYFDGGKSANPIFLRNKSPIPVFPDTDYYFKNSGNDYMVLFYTKDNDYIGYVSSNSFETPSNCRYVCFYVNNSTYNHDICINLSGSMNGTYLPYQAPSEYPIPSEVQALDGYGLGIDDTLYNYIDFERKKFVKKVGIVDLGTLSWGKVPSVYFFARIQDIKKGGYATKLLCQKYPTAYSQQQFVDKTISGVAVAYENNVVVRDSDYDTYEQIQAAMSGVMLIYELAEPVEIDISEYLDRDFPNENLIDTYQGGEVEFENDNDMGVPYSLTYQYKVE